MELIDYNEIGKRIKEKRILKGLTQQKVAEQLQLSDEYMSKIETGKTKISLTRLSQLSIILDTSIEELITGTVIKSTDYKMIEINRKFEELSPKEKDVVINIIEQIKSLRSK